jgi:hypothetical protein
MNIYKPASCPIIGHKYRPPAWCIRMDKQSPPLWPIMCNYGPLSLLIRMNKQNLLSWPIILDKQSSVLIHLMDLVVSELLIPEELAGRMKLVCTLLNFS